MKLEEVKALLQRLQADAQEESEERPYDHLYQQANVLKDEIEKLQGSGADTGTHLALACLHCRRGVLLLETDLLSDGEACVSQGLPVLEHALGLQPSTLPATDGAQTSPQPETASTPGPPDPDYWVLVQSAYNSMGALWSQRGDFQRALQWLERALQLPDKAKCICSAESAKTVSDKLQPGYTSTLFYLAQVHGHAGNKEQSGQYCGLTLERQLQASKYDRSEWVQNCLQLAGYYISTNTFAAAHRCLQAAEAVAQIPTSETAPPGTTALDESVAANLHLAHAKLCRQRLLVAHQRHIQGQQVVVPGLDSTPESHAPEFPTLRLSESPSQARELAQDFDSARVLHNEAMQHYNAALSYYQLDGWVTDHVDILLEISNLIMLLAGFEPNPTRRAAMHKLRAARLAPACGGSLNPEHYLPQVRGAELECGSAWRDCLEARTAAVEAAGMKKAADAKEIALAAQSAVQHYMAFLATFDTQGGKRITDDEPMFLSACFTLGRLLNRCAAEMPDPTKQLGVLQQAHGHLSNCCQYVKRHGVAAYQQEAALAGELATLLAERIAMTQRLLRKQ